MSCSWGQVQFFSVLSGVAASWMLKKIYQFCRVHFHWSWIFSWTEQQSPPHDGAGIAIDRFLSIIKVDKSNNRFSLLLCPPWKDQGTRVDQEEENSIHSWTHWHCFSLPTILLLPYVLQIGEYSQHNKHNTHFLTWPRQSLQLPKPMLAFKDWVNIAIFCNDEHCVCVWHLVCATVFGALWPALFVKLP